ncbi:MAG: hypothetical protein JW953_12805 [Anaerolineae bacterium]|nr:hypothetical protein [Anaerolineae bacterium]
MQSKNLDYLIIIIMVLCGLYAALTGLVMDVLNLPMLIFHNYAGYISTILAGIHLARNWERVKIVLRRGKRILA